MYQKDDPLFSEVRSRRRLRAAWKAIYANGVVSQSQTTRDEVRAFAEKAEQSIEKISRQLGKNQFKFAPQTGILLSQPGKKTKRPIVKAPIENRIVQRSILSILVDVQGISQFVDTPFSFGGVPKRSVASAIEAVQSAISSGATFHIRSDISGFFTKIPKNVVIDKIKSQIDDEEFIDLARQAINVELGNLAELREGAEAFPIHEIGVAQGSSLSPLMGNILLADFDKAMNERGISCFRYIDDFVLLGSKESNVRKAFRSCQGHLKRFGLSAYDPATSPTKAEAGLVAEGMDFLGCRVLPGLVTPSRSSQARLIQKVKDGLADEMDAPRSGSRSGRKRESRFAYQLVKVSETIQSWKSAYWFCNDKMSLSALDKKVSMDIDAAFGRFCANVRSLTPDERRTALGVSRLLS